MTMIDRNKLIKAIEYCTDSIICHGDKCPYWKDTERKVNKWTE